MQEAYKEHSTIDSLQRAVCQQKQRPALPASWPDGLKRLLTRCWTSNATLRPPIAKIASSFHSIRLQHLIPNDDLARFFLEKEFCGIGTVSRCL